MVWMMNQLACPQAKNLAIESAFDLSLIASSETRGSKLSLANSITTAAVSIRWGSVQGDLVSNVSLPAVTTNACSIVQTIENV